MDHAYFDDDSVPIHRIRTGQYTHNEFKQMGVDYVELRVDTGFAPQGTNPKISLRYSNDSGHRWSYSLPRELGKVGQYGKRITWNRLGTSNNWLFEFTITDPVKFAIVDACADISGIEDQKWDARQNG